MPLCPSRPVGHVVPRSLRDVTSGTVCSGAFSSMARQAIGRGIGILSRACRSLAISSAKRVLRARTVFAENFRLRSKPGGTKSVRSLGQVGYERYGLYVGAAKNQALMQKQARWSIVENCRQEIRQVLAGRSEEQPFFFVFGSINAHRPYTPDSGKNLWGIDPDALKGLLPKFLPDAHDVRRDFSDYLGRSARPRPDARDNARRAGKFAGEPQYHGYTLG